MLVYIYCGQRSASGPALPHAVMLLVELLCLPLALATEIYDKTHGPVSYYVSWSGGADSNDGLSPQSPWQR